MKRKNKKGKIIMILTSSLLIILTLLFFVDIQPSTIEAQEVDEVALTEVTDDVSTLVEAGYFSERDFTTDYDSTTATSINLNNSDVSITNGTDGGNATFSDSTITIDSEGTYIVTGEATDIQILITAEDTEKVQLVLDNVSMTTSNRPTIQIESGDKIFITLAENSVNTLADDATRADDSLDAVIFSRSDLTLNGLGELTISGQYHNGIESKDDIRITSGTYTVDAPNTALKANDAVNIVEANVYLTAGNDGIHVENDDDATLGNVYINTTLFEITAQSVGIDAANIIEVTGGTINVLNSLEGFEAKDILISGGVIDITSSDDGLNATNGSTGEMMMPGQQTTTTDTSELPSLTITGGEITINAEGDGLDSNGTLLVSGGLIIVNGPVTTNNSAIDSDSEATIEGGTIIAADGGMMSQGFGTQSTQASISSNIQATEGQILQISDEEGNILFETTLTKSFSNIVFSNADIIEGMTYTISVGETQVQATASMGSDMMMQGPGGMMNGPNNGQGNMTPPEFSEFNE